MQSLQQTDSVMCQQRLIILERKYGVCNCSYSEKSLVKVYVGRQQASGERYTHLIKRVNGHVELLAMPPKFARYTLIGTV